MDGIEETNEVYFEVDTSAQKLGAFAISFVDLTVPVTGIPISRSYDATRS